MAPTRLGTADWANPITVEEKYAFKNGMIWVGRSQHGIPIGYGDDQHVAAVCRTRGGKGTTAIIPTLLEYRGSICVVDPKGENATVTASRRGEGSDYTEGMRQTVHVLDPFRVAKVDESLRSRFNPLAVLDPDADETIDEAARIADALVVVRDNSKDPFWDESARDMVKILILHVVTHPRYKGRRHLVTIRQMLTRGDWESVEALRNAGEEDIPPAQGLLWAEVSKNPLFEGMIAAGGETFLGMLDRTPKVFESVLQVAMRNTEFIDSPAMQSMLRESDFKLSDLKTAPFGVSLYLSLPQRYMRTHYRWLRLMVSLIITEMEKTRRPEVEGLLRRLPALSMPLLMVLDEFAGLKRMEVIENAVSQIAGFGVKLFFILQSLEQLKAVYKDNWETFLANCGLKIGFNIEDNFSREYISKQIGEMELLRETGTHNQASGETGTSTRGESRSRSSTDSENYTTTEGTSRTNSGGINRGSGRSVSESDSISKSSSYSRGENSSEGWSLSRSSSNGVNITSGMSSSATYGAPTFFRAAKHVSSTIGFSDSSSSTYNTSEGTTRSGSKGTSSGSSVSDTEGKQNGRSLSENESRSESWAQAINNGNSKGHGHSEGQTDTVNESETRSRSNTYTTGVQETLHRRPLIQPDEIGRVFASIDDRTHGAYPGVALIQISGQQPAVVRRVNYYEDDIFAGKFDPHPDHPDPRLMTLQERKQEEERRALAAAQKKAEDARKAATAAARKKAEEEERLRLWREYASRPVPLGERIGNWIDAFERGLNNCVDGVESVLRWFR